MAIMPATLKQGQKLLAETTNATKGYSDPSTLRLDTVVPSIVGNVAELFALHGLGEFSGEKMETNPDTADAVQALAGAVALAIDLSSVTLDKLPATTSRNQWAALVGLHSRTTELLHFYSSSPVAFESALVRYWAYLIQHCPLFTGMSLAQVVARS